MKIELRRLILRSPLVVISGIALINSPLVQAQQQGRIEEIVVTAQKRVQSVQDVPIAITAYTAETLQKKDSCRW